MNHSFRLTIAVCCHADTPYFEEMLDSFVNANVAWPKTELLICDDGSPTGGDGDKARKLIGRTDLPFSVRVLRHDSPWRHAASNQHLREEAKGEYLLLFDSDDVFVPFDVTAELDFLDRHPEYCGSYGKKLCFDSEHGFTGACHGGDYSAFEMLVCPTLTVNGMIVRVSDLREAWGFVLPDGSKRDLGNDICLWLGCAQKKAFHFSDHFRALYRIHSGQLTHDAEAEYRQSYRMFRDFCYAHSADLREKLHSGQPLAVPAERRREMLILLGAEFADAQNHVYALRILDIASRIAPEDYGIREMRLRILRQQKRHAEVFREAFLMYAEHPNSPYITLVACRQAMENSREIGGDPVPFQRIYDAAIQRHFQLTTEQRSLLERTCDNARRHCLDGGTPVISIGIPVYNPPMEVFPLMLRSVMEFAMRYNAVEVILHDDASTDPDVVPMLERWRREYPQRIKLQLSKQNQGIHAARQALVEAASGRYFLSNDNDDLLMPFDAAREVAFLDSHQELAATYPRRCLYRPDDLELLVPTAFPSSDFLGLCSMLQSTNGALIRTSMLRACGGYVGYDDVEDDVGLFYKLSLQGPSLIRQEPRVLVRCHEERSCIRGTVETRRAMVARLLEPYEKETALLETGEIPDVSPRIAAVLTGGLLMLQRLTPEKRLTLCRKLAVLHPSDYGCRATLLDQLACFRQWDEFSKCAAQAVADFRSDSWKLYSLFSMLQLSQNQMMQLFPREIQSACRDYKAIPEELPEKLRYLLRPLEGGESWTIRS